MPKKLTKKNYDGLDMPEIPTVEDQAKILAYYKEERDKKKREEEEQRMLQERAER